MLELMILYDYKKHFATKLIETKSGRIEGNFNLEKLKKLFENKSYKVICQSFSEVDLYREYKGTYVVYASSEDKGQFYKQYVEDVILALKEKGAIIIPEFKWFRAHSNKVFQELLRKGFENENLKKPTAFTLGNYKELDTIINQIKYPAVVKMATGAGSSGVKLAKNEKELKKITFKMMDHHYRDCTQSLFLVFCLWIKRLLRRMTGRRVGNETIFNHVLSNRIIIQNFIPELTGDYKVLHFNGKYFVLHRNNRPDDFRASGSGLFEFPDYTDEVKEVLKFAIQVVNEIKMPLESLDIACNNEGCYLIEFQCVFFGPYTLQYAPWCFVKSGDSLLKVPGKFDLEEEYSSAIDKYIRGI